jgi:uncharacterized membrane protein YsdA (DUF1294 family)
MDRMSHPSPIQKGVITEWASKSPFGYAECETGRVFIHINNFIERFKWPEVDDFVSFAVGKDEKGRPCAQSIILVSQKGTLSWKHFAVVLGLLILPALAVPNLREWLSPWWILGCVVIISLLSALNLWFDKNYAKDAKSRIPEATLHLFDLMGGWAGSYLAQHYFRHKISKRSYQWFFWLIVLGHQLVALDLIFGGFILIGFQNLGTGN